MKNNIKANVLRRYKIVSEPLVSYGLQNRTIKSSQDAAKILHDLHENTDIVESATLLLLDKANNVKGHVLLSIGGITGTVIDPVLVLKYAIETLSKAIILCHNHPSGNLKASQADREITQKIQNAAKLFDIQLLDHCILAPDGGYYSFADEGLL